MTAHQKKTRNKIIISSLLLLFLVILERQKIITELLFRILVLVPYWIIGNDILRKAVRGIQNHNMFSEHFLMTVATIGAMILNEPIEGVAVMLFYQIGELFQQVAVDHSRNSISLLMEIRPDYANLVLEDGSFEETDPDEVRIGSMIAVRPGERIPIDGIVAEGSSSLDSSALTGESMPVSVTENDVVSSGCINLNGLLKIRTTKLFEDSTASRILDLIENSSMKKARAEDFIAKFARIYTPIVCYSALALATVPPTVMGFAGHGWEYSEWILRALTFLVISCPCAVVVSIPLSFFSAIGAASKKGILIKGSNYLEALSHAGTVVFDKTGTLTKGVFEVTDVEPEAGISSDQLLEISAYAEYNSTHPIAESIRKAYEGPIDQNRIGEVKETAGYGISACIDGMTYMIGNVGWMRLNDIDVPDAETAGTAVYIGKSGHYLGRIIINDTIKEEADRMVRELRETGVERIVMLTGDNRAAAESAARTLGISTYFAELLPADKVGKLEELLTLKKKGEVLCFVGDGINDAPVITRADIGFAMGALGSDAAIEAADIVLMDDRLMHIPTAIRIAKTCMKIVYQNMIGAIGIKVFVLVLSAFGVTNMWWAVFADVGVMILAVLNSIRLLRY